MLIGDFYPAVEAIIIALESISLKPTSIFFRKRDIVIHPLEIIEGGLSKVEIRLFDEVVFASFNNKIKKIIISEKTTPLSDIEAIELINSAK